MRRVAEAELRLIFNTRLLEFVLTDQLDAVIRRNNHCAVPPADEPRCTHTQTVYYMHPSTGHLLAKAHQYRRPDGSLGVSGLPDPKAVYLDGVIYAGERRTNV